MPTTAKGPRTVTLALNWPTRCVLFGTFHVKIQIYYSFWTNGLEFSEGNKEQLQPSEGRGGCPVLPKLPTPRLSYACPCARTCLAAVGICICSPLAGVSSTRASELLLYCSADSESLEDRRRVHFFSCSITSAEHGFSVNVG